MTTHLERDKREPMLTFRVYSDDYETFYGRISRDVHGNWTAAGTSYPTRAAAHHAVVTAHQEAANA